MKIAVVAPSCPLAPEAVELAQARASVFGAELAVHPQCYLEAGHFAGTDEQRLAALTEVMADDSVDAVWFARGGYGSNRIAAAASRAVSPTARAKTYMGYSDAGFLLAAFHKAGLDVAHGPMVQDALRDGGMAAIDRALGWLVKRSEDALEPGLTPGMPAMAFNLAVLSNFVGTEIEPDFSGRDLLIEEVSEYEYAIDRQMYHVTGQAGVRNVAQMRMGRMSDILENDRPFGEDVDAIVRHWCQVSGITHGGQADIGHDSANRVVPFSL